MLEVLQLLPDHRAERFLPDLQPGDPFTAKAAQDDVRHDADEAPDLLARHRAMLSQHVNVTFPFTVEEIVHMGAGDSGRVAAQKLVDAAL